MSKRGYTTFDFKLKQMNSSKFVANFRKTTLQIEMNINMHSLET